MKEVKTGRIISIPVNRWLDETQDDEDVWREFPISKPGEKPLPGMFCIGISFVFEKIPYFGNPVVPQPLMLVLGSI